MTHVGRLAGAPAIHEVHQSPGRTALGAMVVEIFPLRSRVTSMSIAYSVTLALAGGTAPLASAWLIDTLGQPLAPACYILLHGLVGLALMWPMLETNARPLDP